MCDNDVSSVGFQQYSLGKGEVVSAGKADGEAMSECLTGRAERLELQRPQSVISPTILT
jgi:hypothetical protein